MVYNAEVIAHLWLANTRAELRVGLKRRHRVVLVSTTADSDRHQIGILSIHETTCSRNLDPARSVIIALKLRVRVLATCIFHRAPFIITGSTVITHALE